MSYSEFYVKMKRITSETYAFLNKESMHPWYALLFFASFFLLLYMTLDKLFSLDDQLFHIRFAELLRLKGVAAMTDFNSIYFSKMGIVREYFVYYNFLFYVMLVPFTFITPLFIGMKLYGVFALTLSSMTLYFFLRKIPVRYPFMWVVFFLIAMLQSGWLLRFTETRPFTLAPVFLVVLLYLIFRKKYLAVAMTAFLYFFWHTATFLFPFCLALGYMVFEQFYGRKPDWKLIISPFAGTSAAVALAYLISPGVIPYLKDVIMPVFFDTTFTKITGINEGGEVYGRDFLSTINYFFLFFAAFCVAGSYEITRYIKEKSGELEQKDRINMSLQPLRATLFLSSLIFFMATVLSGRFLDYFVYFSFLYVAIALSQASGFIRIDGALFRKSLKVSAAVVIVYYFAVVSFNAYHSIASGRSHLEAEKPAQWLAANLDQDKIVFNADWDSFPPLYYFTNDKFRFATGLEPRFLYDLDHKLYWKWFNIGQGIYYDSSDNEILVEQRESMRGKDEKRKEWNRYQGNLIADSILDDFGTDIIVTIYERKDLLEVMDGSDRFKKEFYDDKNSAYAIYRIIGKSQ